MANDVEEIRNGLKENKIVIGKDKVLKLMKTGKIGKVFLASNTPKETKEEFSRLGNIGDVPVEVLSLPNDELKVLCKKQHLISVLALSN